MRRRNIKSVAHWVIMSVVLLFPILMVGISSFAQPQQEINVTETYEYDTNEVNSVDDLVVGNIYKYTISEEPTNTKSEVIMFTNFIYYAEQEVKAITMHDYYALICNGSDHRYIAYWYNGTSINFNKSSINIYPDTIDYPFSFYFIYYKSDNLVLNNISASDYLGEKTIDYNITDETMREDVNQWCASFRNLPVNQWYGNLLTAVGLGITTSMMMNVIYTYPLYVLWVYILDLVVDIFLVIINFGHNALKRLGGDNE